MLADLLNIHSIIARCALVSVTAFGICWLCGSRLIKILQANQLGQVVRSDGPKTHLNKQGTPTMGGVLIIIAVLISLVVWADLYNDWLQLLLASLIGFACLGGVDDWQKISANNSQGISAKTKLFWQFVLAFVIMVILYDKITVTAQHELAIPFFESVSFDLGFWLVPFGTIVIVATSNAVNLTDGLDGLVTMPVVLVAFGLGVFAYYSMNVDLAQNAAVSLLPNISEVVIFCAALFGAGLGFLWFNAYPAQLFMGDVGSLALGASLGLVAVLVRQELILIIMGLVFVLEAMSVIIQVVCYKLTKKRLFKMAPLHHHYELKGLPEPKIVVRFWIVTLVLVLLCLMMLHFLG